MYDLLVYLLKEGIIEKLNSVNKDQVLQLYCLKSAICILSNAMNYSGERYQDLWSSGLFFGCLFILILKIWYFGRLAITFENQALRVKNLNNTTAMSLESKESSIFVEAVMASESVASVSSPFQILSGRKRHLSLSEEGSVKKSQRVERVQFVIPRRQSGFCTQIRRNLKVVKIVKSVKT